MTKIQLKINNVSAEIYVIKALLRKK